MSLEGELRLTLARKSYPLLLVDACGVTLWAVLSLTLAAVGEHLILLSARLLSRMDRSGNHRPTHTRTALVQRQIPRPTLLTLNVLTAYPASLAWKELPLSAALINILLKGANKSNNSSLQGTLTTQPIYTKVLWAARLRQEVPEGEPLGHPEVTRTR